MEEVRLACPTSVCAVEAPIKQLQHVGPPLALELTFEVLGSDGAVAVVLEAVLAPCRGTPPDLTNHVDCRTAVYSTARRRIFQVFVLLLCTDT